MNGILIAGAALGGIALVLGICLAVASKVFHTESDSRIEKIIEVLPNANCGGCGFAGCSSFAQAVVNGEASPGGCNAGGEKVAEEIAKILGVDVDKRERNVARINCSCPEPKKRYEYVGIKSCFAANRISGGPTACTYACLGMGDCVAACKFGALKLVDGRPVVDTEKCVGCGQCAKACPRRIIEIVPVSAKYIVACSSKDKGALVRPVCDAGCIGCMICQKKCEYGAINVVDNLAKIDYDKCVGCGECAQACPRKIIKMI